MDASTSSTEVQEIRSWPGIERKRHLLSMMQYKVDMIEELERGISVQTLCRRYGINKVAGYRIKKYKGNILKAYSNLQEEIKVADDLFPNRQQRLSNQKKLDILKKLENGNGEKTLPVRDRYNVTSAELYQIKKCKRKTLKTQVNCRHNVEQVTKTTKLPSRSSKSIDSGIESMLLKWYQQQRKVGNIINGRLIKEQAEVFHKQLGVQTDPNYSQGWLDCFKKRYNIRTSRMIGIDQEPYDFARTIEEILSCRSISDQIEHPNPMYNDVIDDDITISKMIDILGTLISNIEKCSSISQEDVLNLHLMQEKLRCESQEHAHGLVANNRAVNLQQSLGKPGEMSSDLSASHAQEACSKDVQLLSQSKIITKTPVSTLYLMPLAPDK